MVQFSPDDTTGLRGAIARDELFPLFQPQISLTTGAVTAAEGLCRWRHRGAIVPPEVFIPLAERTGDIHSVGCFMIDQCLTAVEDWNARGWAISVSVNVSPVQLMLPIFVDAVAERIAASRIESDALTVEITESLPMTDDHAVDSIQRLWALGVGISLDDYGTGHSDAAQIARLPITEIKIDRTLIQRRDADAVRQREWVSALARDRGILVVAEGVEDESDLEVARSLNCDRVQGYLVARPTDRRGMDALLAA